jgi:pimeloyl-ACP methyl ester carboxylesterase
MAARYPELVRRLILESAVSFLPWPDERTKRGAQIAFNGLSERATWRIVHALVRVAPMLTLRFFLNSLSTGPAASALRSLTDEQRSFLLWLFSRMRSGYGFVNDLRETPDVTAEVRQPTHHRDSEGRHRSVRARRGARDRHSGQRADRQRRRQPLHLVQP